jgi:23S rRNA (adenine2503-C2)-methyltransferase
MVMKKSLLGMTKTEIESVVVEIGLKKFVSAQITDWIYKKHVTSIDEMTNISMKDRERLKEHFEVGRQEPVNVKVSKDGTKKYLFNSSANKFIETAYIPDEDRFTLCVSSQVGCKMGCLFCMTGKQGFQGQLTAGEIINQISSITERDKLTNIVYMGMGEPFDNIDEVLKSLEILTSEYGFAMSPKRITVSTIGIIPGLKRYLHESKCHLAVSLHSPFDEERKKLMPIQVVYPLQDVLNELKQFDFGLQRKVFFEYILFKGLNDTPRHVKEIVKILHGLRCRINLIRFHPIPGAPFMPSEEETIESFKKALVDKGIRTTVRKSRGQDIYAACGLLSTKKLVKQEESDY